MGASPAALAAYILEKFSTWTNPEYRFRPDGGLLEKFTLDELLDNLMIYWITNSITTSQRLYSEQFTKATMAMKIDEYVSLLYNIAILYSIRIFSIFKRKQQLFLALLFIDNTCPISRLPVNVPTACAAFPHEIMYQPESFFREKLTNLVQFSHLPRGGHFAAFEEPALLADDIFKFVTTVEDNKKKNSAKNTSNAEKKIKEPTKI